MLRRATAKASGLSQASRRSWLARVACLLATPGSSHFARGAAPGSANERLPERPVRLIVPFAPGQGSDVLARSLAVAWGATRKQAVLVENRPGANGSLAVQELLRAPADGQHVLVSSNSPIVINPNLYRRLPYQPDDLLPLALLARTDVALVVPTSLGVGRFSELVTRLRERPGAFSYASPGLGSTAHMYMQILSRSLGAEMTHVPYKGSGPALNDLLAGRVQLMFDGLASCMPHVRSGQLRVLAVAGTRASGFVPDVPTTAALGIEGLPGQGWYGAFVRKTTPAEPAEQLRAALSTAATSPAFQAQLRSLFLEPQDAQAGTLAALIAQELASWERLTRHLNMFRTE